MVSAKRVVVEATHEAVIGAPFFMEKILVIGGNGLLGSKIVKLAQTKYDCVPTHRTRALHPSSLKLDITSQEEVFHVFKTVKPNMIMHVAAETNVDRCETDRNWAWKVNAEGTANVAKACGEMNLKLVYVSTDYVFDGEKGLYTEQDTLNPINYYGLTKLKGEEFVRERCKDYLIARTSVLFGWHPWKKNFATWAIEALRCEKGIEVVDDHFNSPTLADNLSEALLEMVEKDFNGIYHTAGSERISRYEFVVKIAKIFDLDIGLVKPIKMKELKAWVAKRPRDSSLCIDEARRELKTKFFDVKESLEFMRSVE